MGGCRCSYKNCQNTTKTTENVHFFHYPVKHKERCKIWIENANKPNFCNLEEDQLRNRVVCEYHFEVKWFPNSEKKRLLQGAVPTLDVGCEEESTETHMYVSTGLQDIQILPASSDGSLFILDTDTIFGRSHKIESFVYKNGMIIPSAPTPSIKQDTKPKQPISRPSTSRNIPPVNYAYNQQIDDSTDIIIQVKDETLDYDHQSIRMQNRFKYDEVYENTTNENDNVENFNSLRKNTLLQKSTVKNSVSRSVPEKTNLAKNYLRKIKQHSRDIACIKKMLRHKAMSTAKPDMDTMLNCLKEQLPPTFFTILNLSLNNRCELTEEDVDFFTTIHKISPDVYQLLVDKYKWILPTVDIVETSME